MSGPSRRRRLAVVLFNLGGSDSPDAVRPFLFNLFNDRAIIGLPQPFRWLLASLISRRRAPVARKIYATLGGASPLLPNTEAQARALEDALNTGDDDLEARVFIAMRYWHPRALEAAERVRDFEPDDIVLLPLYPQYSLTTSGSSLGDWHMAAGQVGLTAPTRAICCYPALDGFAAGVADRLVAGLADAREAGSGPIRILFSAHGLPKKTVARGDPYPDHVRLSAEAVMKEVARRGYDGIDWTICYQSRVGPLEWIGPATEDEIRRAAADRVALVVVPIAFVSEHSETLVELDKEYRELAREAGVPIYIRVATVDAEAPFIDALARLARQAQGRAVSVASDDGRRRCAGEAVQCPMRSL